MGKMVKPENKNISSENEENETMSENEIHPEVILSETGHIQESPEEIAAIEVTESDIEGGIPETEDQSALQADDREHV